MESYVLIQQPHSTLAVGKEQPLQPCASHHRPSRCKTPWKAVGQASGTLQGNQKLTCVMDQPTSMIKQSEGHLCCEPKYWFDRAIRRSPVFVDPEVSQRLGAIPLHTSRAACELPYGPQRGRIRVREVPSLGQELLRSCVLLPSCMSLLLLLPLPPLPSD